jgi:hypothetical protein
LYRNTAAPLNFQDSEHSAKSSRLATVLQLSFDLIAYSLARRHQFQKKFGIHQDLSIPAGVRRHESIIGDRTWRLGIERILAYNDVTTFFLSSRVYKWGEPTTVPKSKQRDLFLTTSLYK